MSNAVSAAAQQQQRQGIQQCPHGSRAYNLGLRTDQRRSVAAWDVRDDTTSLSYSFIKQK